MSKATKQRFLAKSGRDLPDGLVEANHREPSTSGPKDCSPESATNNPPEDGVNPQYSSRESNTSKKTNVGKLKSGKRDERAKRERTRKEKQRKLKSAAARAPSEHLTFSPDEKTRLKMIRILTKRKPANPDRQRMEKRLTTEFLRIYKRRRREVHSGYQMMDQERKHATMAAKLCIIKSVTPTQLIDYWAEHVGDFTGMKFPPLNFLAAAGNVDRVSVEVAITPGKIKPRKAKSGVHAYSGQLDSRLKQGLLDARLIEAGEFSDRYLMTIQITAQAIAGGRSVFVSKALKPLINWAVEHLYAS